MAEPTEPGLPPKRSKIGFAAATVVTVIIAALFITLIVAAISTNGSHELTTLSPHGPYAQRIQNLITPVFIVAGVVFFGLPIFIGIIVFKFRDKGLDDDEMPNQLEGNTAVELGWTIIPAVLLLVIGLATLFTISYLSQTPKNALHVEVSGQQWWWSFHYDMNNDGRYTDTKDGDIITPTELVIPVNTPVALTITSQDVTHSFWIPALNGKKDAVPGQHHPLNLEASKIGVFRGQCTQFCGLSHANMRMVVRSVSKEDFNAWVANQRKTSVEPAPGTAAAAGQALFKEQLCSSCHLIRGVNDAKIASGSAKKQLVNGVAPDLTHFATRGTFAGSIYNIYAPQDPKDPSKPGNPDDVWLPGDPGGALLGGNSSPYGFNAPAVQAWLRNPPLQKPMYSGPKVPADMRRGMPNLNLSEAQITLLVAYLETLK